MSQTNNSDFTRPRGVSTGVLLNTNNEALDNYKKAKKRLSSVPLLEKRIEKLEAMLEQLIREKA